MSSSYVDYVEDGIGDHILNGNGNKIEYTVNFQPMDDWYKPKEPIHVNGDGHLDTEDHHLEIKGWYQQ